MNKRSRVTILMEYLWISKDPRRGWPNWWHISKAYKKTNKVTRKHAKHELEKRLYVTFFVPEDELDNPSTWDDMKTLLEAARTDWKYREEKKHGRSKK